jgi:hypothetical protein
LLGGRLLSHVSTLIKVFVTARKRVVHHVLIELLFMFLGSVRGLPFVIEFPPIGLVRRQKGSNIIRLS